MTAPGSRSMLALAWLTIIPCWGCASDGSQDAGEPVGDGGAVKMPDMPGDAGEMAAKPPGEGQAGDQALPDQEKSQPNLPAAQAAAATAAPEGAQKVRAGALNVRSGAGMAHPVVRVLKKGAQVQVRSCGRVWCQIGDAEFVARAHLEPAN